MKGAQLATALSVGVLLFVLCVQVPDAATQTTNGTNITNATTAPVTNFTSVTSTPTTLTTLGSTVAAPKESGLKYWGIILISVAVAVVAVAVAVCAVFFCARN